MTQKNLMFTIEMDDYQKICDTTKMDVIIKRV
jgi:hypothetical protein